MIRSPNLREKFLDGEKLFYKYIDMGETRTIELLTEWAISQGMTSSSGTEPSQMGVWKAVWRWASLHKNLAWRAVDGQIFGTKNNRFQYTEDTFKLYMREVIRTAWQFTTETKYQKFLQKNGWL